MKHKTLFANLVKLLGVFFVVDGIASAVEQTAQFFVWSQSPPTSSPMPIVLIFVSYFVRIILGLTLFNQSKWVADLAVPGNRPYCPECGYDLTGSVSAVCPECGHHPTTGRQNP
jgi:hypothetical protein